MIYYFSELINLQIMNSISLDQLLEVEKNFFDTLQSYWREHNYLSFKWWILVILSFFAPIVWWMIVDKKRITEITSFGLFFGVAAILLDSIGSTAMLWTYPVRLTPYLYPQYYPYDVGIVIVPFMYVYQKWGNNFKKFVLFAALQSAVLAFIAEPLMEWLKIYKELTWKSMFSFPIYWFLAIICCLIITRFKKLEQRP
ncbi:CBO0543 family protein [Peribacillus alkalitolerans]|uniref:CBO0543 family protein n=1 Tax=Peribacillus alkalitolerans TaxID=1550385 RepID=UPI0013D45BFA|nr:CBO0543 family protein [Peribacillus alkalitolerans]